MLLVIDNYDSFTYNLVQYFSVIVENVLVYRNDKISLTQINHLAPDQIVISPGPKTPDDAGITLDLIRNFAGKIPILGVCLGHQAIGQAFGGKIIRAKKLMHGKTSEISHDNINIYKNIPQKFVAGRYHSLVIEKSTLPKCLKITATSPDGEIMGVRHNEYLLEGVQFHPESILTPFGMDILKNFIALSIIQK